METGRFPAFRIVRNGGEGTAAFGGAVVDQGKHIRFGNGVEFWNGTSYCTVEHCLFEDIYDPGVTYRENQEKPTCRTVEFLL